MEKYCFGDDSILPDLVLEIYFHVRRYRLMSESKRERERGGRKESEIYKINKNQNKNKNNPQISSQKENYFF